MKKTVFIYIFVLLCGALSNAQQIAVVPPGAGAGVASEFHTDLNLAIQNAPAGSTLYLSGGGFQINDATKITKQLAIIGAGYRPDNQNADGSTIISGNIFFEGNSHSSALLGIRLSGEVYIGTSEQAVTRILVRYCDANSIQVRHPNCQHIEINQNRLRGGSNGGGSPASFTNNILHSVGGINGGVIAHNVITSSGSAGNSQVKNNIFLSGGISSSVTSHNMATSTVGDNCVVVSDWADVLVGPLNGTSAVSSYRLKGETGKTAASDGTEIGIYGGTGFKETPPIPRIVSKSLAEHSDKDGKLQISITIKEVEE